MTTNTTSKIWVSCVALGLGAFVGCGGGTSNASGSAAEDTTGGSLSAGTSSGAASAESTGASASAEGTGTTGSGAETTTTANVTNDDGGDDAKFDVLGVPDAPEVPCSNNGKGGGGGDEPEFSYLWAANSSEGTISKIDTQTVTEVGRFIVRPDSAGSPSRTSVNLEGDVAVANRSGGITKIYALEERCSNTNGQPGIQTSDNNVALPWGEEECVAWYSPFNFPSQRPVAWTQGEFNVATCRYENANLWTSGTDGASTEVLLLDGEDGAVIDQVTLAGFPADYYGIYGGAVDAEGNFWGTKLGGVQLVRVDIDDLSYTTWPVPTSSYGMTVDADGYVWACSGQFSRFDPETETWEIGNGGGYSGCMAERGEGGLLWMASSNQLIGIDRETLAPVQMLNVPGSYGVSIDYYGYVWTVAYYGGAHRVDKTNGDVVSYNGLVGAYTYSDMTGYALTYAGGGTPSG
jgi:hypothetical protein